MTDFELYEYSENKLKEKEKRIAELEKENAELKDEIHTWKEASSTNSYKAFQSQEENKTLSGKLIKAKEIIKKFSEFVNNEIEYDPEHPQEHTDLWNKLCEQAEQFLNSEV